MLPVNPELSKKRGKSSFAGVPREFEGGGLEVDFPTDVL